MVFTFLPYSNNCQKEINLFIQKPFSYIFHNQASKTFPFLLALLLFSGVLYFNDISLKGIHHTCIPDIILSWKLPSIIHMHMSMNKIFWMIFFDQTIKYLKSPMAYIFPIMNPFGRGMCYEYIKAPVKLNLPE